ncbi:MAG: FAD-binding oxidoreductase [Candidatus Calescibacterium sp.]|nr:FAD-binding oxidoreductase [Candidatus Calescibacterium sp.]MCX7733292.1 FAD-binding oxidoreductase [bacterium]MDW8086786.1 FAD-binding oxidoreductase [Candidatus Calescibacterium sp.]
MIQTKIVEKKELAPQTFLFKFDLHLEYEPGQFVMISSPSIPWIIPKPFSILSNGDGLSVLFKIYGLWTEKFSKLEVGDFVNVVGPCGVGFISSLARYGINSDFSKILFIAGGVGIASVFSLFGYFKNSKNTLVFGGRINKDIILLDEISKLGVEIFVSTEDGSAGTKGRVTDVLHNLNVDSFDIVFSCGPVPMMKAVSEFFKQKGINKPLIFALEERMACGIGICFSCAVKTKDGMKLCCKYGPAFSNEEIVW